MKHVSVYVVCSALLLFASSLKAQEKENIDDLIDKEFGGKTLAQIRTALVNQSKDINGMQNLSSMRFVLKPATTTKKEKYTEPFVVKSAAARDQAFTEGVGNFDIYTTIRYPKTDLSLSYQKAGELYPDRGNTSFIIRRLHFKDGTTMERNDTMSYFDGATIPTTKPIASVDIIAAYTRPENITKITLDKNTTSQQVAQGMIELKSIGNNTVRMVLPDSLRDYIVQIEGLNSAGKSLENYSSSYSSTPSEETMQILNKYNAVIKTLIQNIDAKKYANTAACIADIKNKTANIPILEANDHKLIGEFGFSGNVSSVNLYLKDDDKTIALPFTLKNIRSFDEKSQLAVAFDDATDNSGLVNYSGEWAVPPTFNMLHYHEIEPLYYGREHDTSDLIYMRYDAVAKKLLLLNFEPKDTLTNTLLEIQREANGPLGIYNLLTNEIVLPMKFGYMSYMNGLLAARLGENTYSDGLYGGYNLVTGKEVVPFKYADVITDGDYFYTEQRILESAPQRSKSAAFTNDAQSEEKNIFSRAGKKINPDNSNYLSAFVNGQPALIQYKNGKRAFIDSTGNVAIDAAKYEEVKEFSNGIAIVKLNGKYGAINTKGELQVPCIYLSLLSFQGKYAMAEKAVNDKSVYQLIDKNNKTVVTFNGTLISSSHTINGDNANYYIRDAQGKRRSYDENGKDTTKGRKKAD